MVTVHKLLWRMNEDTCLKKTVNIVTTSFFFFKTSLHYSKAPKWCQFTTAYGVPAINDILSCFDILLLL